MSTERCPKSEFKDERHQWRNLAAHGFYPKENEVYRCNECGHYKFVENRFVEDKREYIGRRVVSSRALIVDLASLAWTAWEKP